MELYAFIAQSFKLVDGCGDESTFVHHQTGAKVVIKHPFSVRIVKPNEIIAAKLVLVGSSHFLPSTDEGILTAKEAIDIVTDHCESAAAKVVQPQ